MKVTEYKNILTNDQVKILLDYLYVKDDRYDERPDVISKHPLWNQSDWPQKIIEDALNKIFPNGYTVGEISIIKGKISLKPHSDWLNGYYTVIFALDFDPEAHTIFFKNTVPQQPNSEHPAVFLQKTKWTPFQYNLPNKNGEFVYVDDIRDLLNQAIDNPESLSEFDVNNDFINELRSLIKKRSSGRLEHNEQNDETGYVQCTPRIQDYASWVTGYDENAKFPTDIHEKYLAHVNIEDLHGLFVDKIVDWSVGTAFAFHGAQVHSASSAHNTKTFMTVFLRRN
jgi:hypothetical protein